MSTLTSTPSPATSPRSSFHVSSRASSDHLARGSPRLTFTSSASPKRPFYAPSPLLSAGSGTRKRREESAKSPEVGERGRYVHVGTQYSPDGFPPTAGRKVARTTVEQPPGSTSSVGKKRKERDLVSGDPMTASGDAGLSSSFAAVEASGGPPEPEPRIDPEPAQNDASVVVSDLPTPSEPQEARSTDAHSSTQKRSRSEPGSVKTMPQRYWTCNSKDLGVLISSMLMELIRLNDQIPLRDGRLTRFHSRAPPGISVSDYLQRLIHHATLSPPILLSMVWYIDRLCAQYPAFTINSLTVHRFLITAATVAAKGLSDSFWTNPTYAKIGGIPVSELATLELEFLQKVHWKIVPKPEHLEQYYRSLVDRTEGFELEAPLGSISDGSSVGDTEDTNDEDEKMAEDPT